MVIGKKSDAHDSKESPRFASRLKNTQVMFNKSGSEHVLNICGHFSCVHIPQCKLFDHTPSQSDKSQRYHITYFHFGYV